MSARAGRFVCLLAASLAIVTPLGFAQAETPFAPPTRPRIALEVASQPANGSGEFQAVATVDIQQGWHINSHQPLDEYLIPTELKIDSTSVKVKSISYPAHIERSFSFSAGAKVAVYEGRIRIPFSAVASSAGGSVKAVLHYQSCNDSVCLPPADAVASFVVPVGLADASGTTNVSPRPSESAKPSATPLATDSAAAVESPLPVATEAQAPPASGNFTPLSAAPPAGSTSLFTSDVGATLASRGLLLTLLSVFVLGLALNLTPCVYPLIPITVAFFSSQSEGRRSTRVMLSFAYVLGIAVTYSVLGVFSAMTGKLFGAWLQLPAVLIFFAVLMLILSASMFGLFDIRVPHFITDRAGARGGVLGALTMGLLVGIVAAPCVGPFVISLIALVGQSGSIPLGFILFFTLALGLGVPYLLLGIFSSALESIPRSGMWMVQVKKAMGFILIAMAFYFLRPLLGEAVYRWGVGACLIVGAVFLFFTGRSAQRGGEIVRIVAGLLMLVAGLLFVIPRSEGPEISWKPLDDASLSRARAAGQPVLIDFYADWCLPCKELDRETFTEKGVRAEADRFARLKANLTNTSDPAIVALSRRYAIVGVPTIVFLDWRGNEIKHLRLTGFEKAGDFIRRMQQVH
ncbi:MAG: cytochrome c biogenesis protein CcdA [Acidobacteriota bacterium]